MNRPEDGDYPQHFSQIVQKQNEWLLTTESGGGTSSGSEPTDKGKEKIMGRECAEFNLSASLSRHNSEQDDIDNALWEELIERIRLIAMEHRYEPINPFEV